MLTTSDICCDPRHALLFSCSGKHKASVTTTLPPQRKLNVSRDALPLTASNYSSNPWTHTKNDQLHRIHSFSSYPQSYQERHPQTIFFLIQLFVYFHPETWRWPWLPTKPATMVGGDYRKHSAHKQLRHSFEAHNRQLCPRLWANSRYRLSRGPYPSSIAMSFFRTKKWLFDKTCRLCQQFVEW